MTDQELLANLGPLGSLAGIWEGDQGVDIAPSPSRGQLETPYRERMVFEPMGPVENHEQRLFGLRYSTTATPIGEEEPFHEELGYWLWDGSEEQVMRCFLVPRGVTILAGGQAAADASSFSLAANVGSDTYGIASNLFLDREFKTVRYDLTVCFNGADEFRYEEETQLLLKGLSDPFHHLDSNTLRRVG